MDKKDIIEDAEWLAGHMFRALIMGLSLIWYPFYWLFKGRKK